MLPQHVTVVVPATSANLGPGFDCFGLALKLYNEVKVSIIDRGLEIKISGEDASTLPYDERNMVYRAIKATYAAANEPLPGLRVEQINMIPVGSGLGSSSAAIASGMLAANHLLGGALDQQQLLNLGYALEGHPDNLTSALLGGLTASMCEQSHVYVEKLPVAEMRAVVVLPGYKLSTLEARAALPSVVPFRNAAHNLSRLPFLMRGLADANLELLALAMNDALHQPYRIPLIPNAEKAVEMMKMAGASATTLSGAGPALLAFAEDELLETIGRVGQQAFQDYGIYCRYWVLAIDNQGAQIVPDDVIVAG